jgi:flagellar biosynthesis anti-sigma factor FlgM
MMKVSDSGNYNIQHIYQSQTGRATQENQSGQPQRVGDWQDSVELSARAQLLQKAKEAVAKEDPARIARITELREQVQNDAYQAPVQQLAMKISSLFS